MKKHTSGSKAKGAAKSTSKRHTSPSPSPGVRETTAVPHAIMPSRTFTQTFGAWEGAR